MYKRKRINTNKYDWTLRTATLFLSLSLMSCALNEEWEKPSVCLWWCFLCFCIKPSGCYCSAVSASTSKILLEVKFMNLFHFLQWETLDLVQQHKNTRWLFYWTFGRCWTDWFSECSSQTEQTETRHRKPNRSWTWLGVNHTRMVSSGLLFTQRNSAVYCPFNELQYHVTTPI